LAGPFKHAKHEAFLVQFSAFACSFERYDERLRTSETFFPTEYRVN